MDLRGKNVLLIGDSHTAAFPFGENLVSQLKNNGANLTVAAVGGTSAYWWLIGYKTTADKVASLGNKKFDVAIIAMGTNDAANSERSSLEGGSSLDKEIKKVTSQIKQLGKKYSDNFIWVGPPKMRNTTKYYSQSSMDLLYNEANLQFGSSVIDSRKYMPATIDASNSDGVHIINKSAAKVWSDGVIAAILSMPNLPNEKNNSSPASTQQPSTTQLQNINTQTPRSGGGYINPAGTINSNIVDINDVIGFESKSINGNDSISTPLLQINSTTVGGYMMNKIENDHKDNVIASKNTLYGTVLRVPKIYGLSNYDPNQIIAAQRSSKSEQYCKVRVVNDDDAFFEIPETYDGTPKDIEIINQYRDFKIPANLKLAPGDRVEVMYGDSILGTDGIILRRIPQTVRDKIITSSANTSQFINNINAPLPNISLGSLQNINQNLSVPLDTVNNLAPNLKFVNDAFDKILARSRQYDPIIRRIAAFFGLPVNHIKAFIGIESGFINGIPSPAGAEGLMQVMPYTRRGFLAKKDFKELFLQFFGQDVSIFDTWNANHNMFMGAYFYRILLKRFNGDIQKSAAGYNAGPGAVKKTSNWHLIIPKETRDYIIRMPLMLEKFRQVFPNDG